MKSSSIALVAAVVLATALPAQAEGEAKSALDFANWLGLGPIAANPGSTAKSGNAAHAARLRRQRARQAAEAEDARAAERGQVAASAQVVKTPPVAKTKAAAVATSLASGEARPSLDCRQFIPTAGMTISVACAD